MILSSRLPTPYLMAVLGLDPDPWQIDVIDGNHRRLLLNCSRQAGKTTAVALLSLFEGLFQRDAVILLLSRSLRQATELFRQVKGFAVCLRAPRIQRSTSHELELYNGSRIISLPCSADTIRGFAGVSMLVIDEAARVPDNLYHTVRPMLAASDGKLVCLSTPSGRRGFFHDAWAHGGADWHRVEVPAAEVTRISARFLEEERRCHSESWFRQEYCCSFESMEGLVYPDFAKHVAAEPPAKPPEGKHVGGIDFGFRNPFAAVWGVVDRDDVLWLTGEHYRSQQPLSEHARHLPRQVTWYADPAGASDIAELRCADFVVRQGRNSLRTGITAVTARLHTGRLRVLPGACPNLLREASLYRWSETAKDDENPVDEHNHALAALRYLISRIDEHKQARPPVPAKTLAELVTDEEQKRWLSWRNEALWRPLR